MNYKRLQRGGRAAMYNLIFVCQGNTCRSPMAAGLAKAWLDANLPDHASRFDIQSAGLMAYDGSPPSEGAVEAVARYGCDISSHRSRYLTPGMARGSTIIAMTKSLAAAARKACPDAVVHTLSSWAGQARDEGVRDPFHGADIEYIACCDQIKRLIAQGFERMVNFRQDG